MPPGSEKFLGPLEKQLVAFHDPEPQFSQATTYNSCLGNDFTSRVMKSAIDGGYCGYDVLQNDPLLKEFRKSSQYPALLAQAKQCRDRFLVERDHPQPQ
jgi:hypothetical protein